MVVKTLSAVIFLSILTVLNAQNPFENRISSLIEKGSLDEALFLCDSALSGSTSPGSRMFFFSKKGDIYYFKGDIRRSLSYYLKALEETDGIDLESQKLLADTYSYAGFCLNELGLIRDAIPYFEKSLELAIQNNDSVEVAVAYFNISNSLLKLGKTDSAIDYLSKAYEIDIARQDTSAIGYDLNAIGYALLVGGQPGKSIDYFHQSLALLGDTYSNPNSVGTRYNNISKAYMAMQQWDSALHYTLASIHIHEKLNDSVNLAERWINMANISNSAGNIRDGIVWGKRARNYFEAIGGDQLISANNELIRSYMLSGRYSESLPLVDENIRLSKQLGSLTKHQESLKIQAELYDKLGQSQKAYLVHQEYMSLKDSLLKESNRRVVEEMQVKYEVDKIQNENRLLQLENQVNQAEIRQKNTMVKWLIITIVITMISSLLITVTLISRSKYKDRMQQAEISELRTKIKAILEFKPDEVGIVKEQVNKSLEEPLSDREFEILNLALSDKNNAQIAEEMFVSVNTVKFHLKNIYTKLGVANRKEALKYAVQASSKYRG